MLTVGLTETSALIEQITSMKLYFAHMSAHVKYEMSNIEIKYMEIIHRTGNICKSGSITVRDLY